MLALYPHVFPDEDLTPVVTDLLQEPSGILSLIGLAGDQIVAHVIFTLCHTEDPANTGALLGPLGVRPSHQGQGIGTDIVWAGLDRLSSQGASQVFVLGDPGYYSRFGFQPERHVETPCPIPKDWAEAWQSMTLSGRNPLNPGGLIVPTPWMEPALWAA